MNKNCRIHLSILPELHELAREVSIRNEIEEWKHKISILSEGAHEMSDIWGHEDLLWAFDSPEDDGEFLLGKRYVELLDCIRYCYRRIDELEAQLNL